MGRKEKEAGEPGLHTAPEALPALGPRSRPDSLHPHPDSSPLSGLAISPPVHSRAWCPQSRLIPLGLRAAHADPTCLSPV